MTVRAARPVLLLIGALLAIAPAAHAAPGDYRIGYDWRDAGTGFAGWGAFNLPPDGTPGLQTPFYSTRLAPPGIRIAPSPASDGTRDRVYPPVDEFGPRGIAQVTAPGTTRIRRATFDHINFRRRGGERQFLRLAVYGDGGDDDADVYDFRPDSPPPGPFLNDVTYTDVGPITVRHPRRDATTAQVWLLSSCDPSCPTVTFDADGTPRSFGEVRSVELDLFDPEPPAIAVAGELATSGWTNARTSRGAQVVATDPGSGIRTVRVVRRRAAGATVRVADANAPCDRDHRTGARGAAPCPDRFETGFAQSLGSLPDGEYVYEATATDDSDRTATASFRLGLDRARPRGISAHGPLRSLLGRWTSRRGAVPITVRARDTRSGVRRIELLARAGGADRPLGARVADCGFRCPGSLSADLAADLGTLPDGRQGLVARVTDLAGNVRDRRLGTLRIDHTAPGPPRAVLRSSRSRKLLRIGAAVDPAPGSGVDHYVISFHEDGRRRLLQVAATDERSVRGATVARLPRRTTGDVRVFAVDRAGNSGPVAVAALKIPCIGIGPTTRFCNLLKSVGKAIERYGNKGIAVVGGFACGEAGVCKVLPGRSTVWWLSGELASGFIVLGDARDAILGLLKFDLPAAGLAVVGLLPVFGDAIKAIKTVQKFVKRTHMPLRKVMDAVVGIGGTQSRYTRRVLDTITHGAYGRLRDGDLSHAAVEQLLDGGNDIRKLTRLASLTRHSLTKAEIEVVERNLRVIWGNPTDPAKRAEALGVESAIKYLQRDKKIEILVHGRPNEGLGRNGPDIVAYNRAEDRLFVIEAKGTLYRNRPLTGRKLTARVKGADYIQPSPAWLQARRRGANDYLALMLRSNDPRHNQAAQLLREVFRRKRQYDARIVNVRPDIQGAQAYGGGLDRAAEAIHSPRVNSIRIVDIPYPNRL